MLLKRYRKVLPFENKDNQSPLKGGGYHAGIKIILSFVLYSTHFFVTLQPQI